MKKIFVSVMIFASVLLSGCLTTVSSASLPLSPDIPPAADSGRAPEGFVITDKVVNEYDESGNLVKKTVYYKSGVEDPETFLYEYDETGLRIKRSTFNRKGNLAEYELYENDETGRRIKETEFRPSGALKNYKVYDFDDKNSTVTKRYFNTDNKVYRLIISIFDSEGNLLEETDSRIE
jgi:antitoxin component YwqK of YwqJK toxin-antitoxin module